MKRTSNNGKKPTESSRQMRGAGNIRYEYILEQRIEGSSDLVGFAGIAPVTVQGYHRYPDEAAYVNML